MKEDPLFRSNPKDNSNRRYKGEGGPRPDKNEQKRADHFGRLEVWQELSPKRQLQCLDGRLGKDVGAKKQREKLVKLIAAEEAAKKRG